MAAHFGWRSAFLWAGAPGLLLALALLPFAEAPRGGADGGGALNETNRPGFLRIFQQPKFNLIVWGYTAYTFALGGFAIWAPTFLTREHGLPERASRQVLRLWLVFAGLAGTLAGGFAATAWQRRNPCGLRPAVRLVGARGRAPRHCRVSRLFRDDLHGVSGGRDVAPLSLHRAGEHARHRERARQFARSAIAAQIFMIHLFGDMWSPEIIGRACRIIGTACARRF